VRTAPRHHRGPLAGEPPVDRARARRHQQLGLSIAEVEFAIVAQHGHQHRRHRRQLLARRRRSSAQHSTNATMIPGPYVDRAAFVT
jgi:hypothetical protein